MLEWLKNKFKKEDPSKLEEGKKADEKQAEIVPSEEEILQGVISDSELTDVSEENDSDETLEKSKESFIEKDMETDAPDEAKFFSAEQKEMVENTIENNDSVSSSEKPSKLSFFQKIVKGLTKTRDNLSGKIDDVLFSFKKIDESLFEELEEILITADIGVQTTMLLIDNLRERIKKEKTTDPQEVKALLKDEILQLMNNSVESNELCLQPFPAIILVVGVNGVGKTTTIGKLSAQLKSEGKNVLICAADTFRAAAIEQLEEWGKRSGVNVISHAEGSDPAAVVFDAINAAKARNVDVLICDTAGRLHNKSNLMNELNKIFRVSEREFPNATREVLLVLDATTGQNAMNQAKTFKEVANITGIALTKLDGTAKGGVVIALENELNIPVKLVGVGEGIDDLQPFENKSFVEAIFQ